MTLTQFTSGVNTSFSTKLNGNFDENHHLMSFTTFSSSVTTTTGWGDLVTLTGPTAQKDSHKVWYELHATGSGVTTNKLQLRVYDVASSTVLGSTEWTGSDGEVYAKFIMGTTDTATSGTTEDLKVQAQVTGAGQSVNGVIRAMLIPDN